MDRRASGVLDILIILVAMAFGAVFVFLAYELGQATRPGQMMVWGSNETTSSPAPNSSGTASAPAISTTPTSSTTASGSEGGKAVFDKNCGACHPGRGKGVGPALDATDLKQRYPQDNDLANVIRGGKGIMPAFKSERLPDEELQSVIAYLRSSP